MGSTRDKFYEKLATALAKKYEEEKDLLSVGAKASWLPCYDEIGSLIRDLEQQGHELSDILQFLSRHLPKAFPYTAPYRFSRANLLRMKDFTCALAPSPELARWELARRPHWHGVMPSNFNSTLPQGVKEEAGYIFKNAYRIPFPAVTLDLSKLKECHLEEAFVTNSIDAMREMGPGFTLEDRQVNGGGKKYKYDVLLYQRILKCHVIIDFKIGDFKEEYIEKMVKYLQCANMELKQQDDQAPMGIFLCRTMDEEKVEDLLKEIESPIGVARYCF
jgi:hypothetical protein